MGTYLWCPDEIEQMKAIGNARAWALYTGGATKELTKPSADAPFEEVDDFVRNKYERKMWMLPGGMAAVIAGEQSQPSRCRSTAGLQSTGMTEKKASTARVGGRNSAARDAARNRVGEIRTRKAAAVAAPSIGLQRVDSGTCSGSDDWGSFQEWPATPNATIATTAAMTPQIEPPPSMSTPKELTLEEFFLGRPSYGAAPATGASDHDLISLFGAGVGAAPHDQPKPQQQQQQQQQQHWAAAVVPPPPVNNFRPFAYA